MTEHLMLTDAQARDDLEIQTDKANGKVVTCTVCDEQKIFVNAFYAPAQAKCSGCRPATAPSGGGAGTQAVVQKGRTDPAKAANLADVLINPHFAFAICPVAPDDPEGHSMELKSVDHHDYHGPSEHTGYQNGRPVYRQSARGETVLHQCLECKAVVTYSTTAQSQFRRLNEPSANIKTTNGWGALLGVREGA